MEQHPAAIWLLVAGRAQALDVAGVLPTSIGLPEVNVVLRPTAGAGPYSGLDSFGFPLTSLRLIYDTGASGFIVFEGPAQALGLPVAQHSGSDVVFEDVGVLTEDTVHLHLEQRVAQRLLARFRSQGFIHHDLARLAMVRGDWGAARTAAGRALEIRRGLGLDMLSENLHFMGFLELERRRLDAARECFEEAESVARESGEVADLQRARAWLALLGDQEPDEIEVPAEIGVMERVELHSVLAAAGAGADHARRADELMAQLARSLPAGAREALQQSSPLAAMRAALARLEH